MLYIRECSECNAEIHSFCHEFHNYTEAGWQTRVRQLDSRKCISCFGETPELKAEDEQMKIPYILQVDLRNDDVKISAT